MPSPKERPMLWTLLVTILAVAIVATVVITRHHPRGPSSVLAPAPATTAAPTTAAPPTTTEEPRATTPGGSAVPVSENQIIVDGVTRTYLLVRPATVSPAKRPVLVELHGCCISPAQERARSGFDTVTQDAIVVYAAGLYQSWNAGTCCHEAQVHDDDDVGFITALVRHILATEPDAAADQVYLAGYSNGGKMAMRIACEAPAQFAGIAAYGAVSAMPCARPGPVSLLELASTGDPELTIRPEDAPTVINGFTTPSVDEEVAQYVQADGCDARGVNTDPQGSLSTTIWSSCAHGRRVQLSLYAGGSHAWPPAAVGDTPSAEQVMWSFFRSLARSPA